jgi:hypothetical protein
VACVMDAMRGGRAGRGDDRDAYVVVAVAARVFVVVTATRALVWWLCRVGGMKTTVHVVVCCDGRDACVVVTAASSVLEWGP